MRENNDSAHPVSYTHLDVYKRQVEGDKQEVCPACGSEVGRRAQTIYYVKRVIGMPGDVIDIIDDKVYLNGSDTPLDEPYLAEPMNLSLIHILVMFIGAAVHLLQKTGAIEVAFKSIAGGGKNANDYVIAFAIMLFMTIGGACGVFANPTVALVPIGIILSQAIGLDAASGMMLVYLGAYSGFNIGWANPSTLGVAHPIAELPVFSGICLLYTSRCV